MTNSLFGRSSNVTQMVAFGTRIMRDDSGNKTRIANVIRRDQNATLSRSVRAYLEDQKCEEIPSLRTVDRILKRY